LEKGSFCCTVFFCLVTAVGFSLHKSNASRLAKLTELLARLRRGEIVQNRQLRSWLGEQGYKEYEESWSNTVDQRNLLSSKSGAIIEYEELLKKAILLYNRGEAASLRGKQSSRQLHAKAQVAFERALLFLEEQLSLDPSLQIWLDRNCDFSASGNLGLDPVSVPRAITSRSLDNQSDGIKTDSKRQCKIRAVETEIERIKNPNQYPIAEDISQKLTTLKMKMRK
jgi:hypothetical protein